MGIHELAEAIVLQTIEDLWDPRFRRGSLTVLRSSDFEALASMIDIEPRQLFLSLGDIASFRKQRAPRRHSVATDRPVRRTARAERTGTALTASRSNTVH